VTEENPRDYLEHSIVLATGEEVDAAVDRMVAEINACYDGRPIILLIVMTGALMPAAWIARRLDMPLRLDFIHATRYDGATEGGDILFRVPPRLDLEGQDVLIVEDIYDVGLTLQSIVRYCREHGARSVRSAVLVRKVHDRETTGELPEFIGLDIEDRYIFGCGMDIHEHWRHLGEIRALEDT
jgi:hypoxanthine phosphoribosyltransferase